MGPLDDHQLASRYRENYDLAEDAVTLEQIRGHLELERGLTRELLDSTPDDRWDTFERCYNQLYESLPWLAGTGGTSDHGRWLRLLDGCSTVFEVGSGAGGTAQALAGSGLTVRATDVSRERGDRVDTDRLTWGVTDGVHLDRFEKPASYDAVISDQVIEHLHPDDLGEHFASSRRILRSGGRYVFRTPHAMTGPHDVSRVFGLSRPVGMHLREYTYRAIIAELTNAGFSNLQAVFTAPKSNVALPSVAYLRLLVGIETGVGRLSRPRPAKWLGQPGSPFRNVFMVAS